MLLFRGMKGDDVAELQRLLTAVGYDLLVDGDFGPVTQLAVRSVQKDAGLKVDGIYGPVTQAALTRRPPAVAPGEATVYWDLMYGLGDAATSAGMDLLASSLRASSKRRVVAKTVSWTQRAQLVERIRARPRGSINCLAANSMGANAIPMVTNACPEQQFLLVAGYDPTIWWSCPALGRNIQHAVLYHGMNWLNPIGHARYTAAFEGQLETVGTYTLHGSIDDDLGLHRITLDRAQKFGA